MRQLSFCIMVSDGFRTMKIMNWGIFSVQKLESLQIQKVLSRPTPFRCRGTPLPTQGGVFFWVLNASGNLNEF
jgi:hypothetical protein